MNSFIRKFKKRNKIAIATYFIILIGYIISCFFITTNVLSLTGIETTLRIICILFIYFLGFIYFIFAFLSIMDKRKKTFIFLSIVNFLAIIILLTSSFFLNSIFAKVNSLNQEYVTYTTNYISLSDTKITKNSKIGMINKENDTEGYVLPKEYISDNNIKNEIIYYDDYIDMLMDLYDHKIDALFITSNYIILYENEEVFKNIKNDTKIIDSYRKRIKNTDISLATDKPLTEPFTLLLMGVDSEKDGLDANIAFNGDTLMIITFNPNTLNATMFSIPRDMYVPISCRKNAKAKINSSAAYGTECVIDTVEQFSEIEIDYYVKINFKGAVDLVNALGGIEVDVTKDFCEQDSNRLWGNNTICLKKGYQKLNGEQALAFARHRKTLIRGDIDRVQNQQKVVEAIAKKAKDVRSFNEFKNIINSITNNMSTNMSTDQILSFYTVGKTMVKNSLKGDSFITIDKTYLEYYDLPIYLAGSNTVTSALGYYTSSLSAIKQVMKDNLSKDTINTYSDFNYTYLEDYEPIIYGKGLTGNKNDVTMTKLIGKTIGDAQYFASHNNLVLNVSYVNIDNLTYNSSYGSGIIVDQSIRYGSVLNPNSTLTIYVNE